MKFALATTTLAFMASAIKAECTESMTFEINSARKLSFSGFNPSVTRTVNTGAGNKVVLRGYNHEPVINEAEDGTIQVSLGNPCDGEAGGLPVPDPEAPDLSEGASAASMTKYLGWGLAALVGHKSALAGSTLAMSVTVGLMSSSAPTALAQQDVIAECELVPIEVEIYVDAMVDEIVQMEYQTGEFEMCPPETMYWEHHPMVFGGYSGCVAERGLYPCASDAMGVDVEEGEFYAQSPVYWDGQTCVETDYTMANRTFWILWGHPMDKYEINKRSGINPVVSFPFNRMPYSLYELGGDPASSQDDSNDARMMAKELLEYIGAWTMEELEDFSVTITEGAEQGMVHLYAAKAMEIAQTTCNRDINVLMEVPGYGYSTSDAALIANQFADTFYNSSECECFATDSCKDPTVTVTVQGWLPNTPFPEATGGDGVVYAANSDSPNSPWFESMVFPENPTGVIKTPQLSDPNRRVCDGVYLWPMYLGARDFMIPKDEIPDCSAWSFSISKIYSAAARAGWIMYKKDPETNHQAMIDAIGTSQTLTHGSLSEWTWHGQMQLFEAFMSKPLEDPTSWIGAYTEIMREKWDAIMDGFADCPVTQPSNPYSGAYVWFVFQDPYLGVQDSSTPSFFRDVLGVEATTYSWGFRGATPSDYYGEGYGSNDFTRLQLYRDLGVYQELGRRAKIVCSDLDASISDSLVSVNQWVEASTATRSRRLGEGYATFEDRKRHLKESVPGLTERQLQHMANGQVKGERTDAAIESCAPEYATHCLFESIGMFGPDDF